MADTLPRARQCLRHPLFHLLLVTAAGGGLRFWRLGRQSAWMDEAITGYRLAGSFDDLIRSLGNQAFGPAWYALLYGFKAAAAWGLGDGAAVFRPAVLRLVPAAVGTLVVPSMYLLARQFRGLAEPRWALFAAGLAAVNPYAVYYARDLKMYGLLLTLFTLQVACLLRFLRTRRPLDFTAATATLAVLTLTHLTALWLVAVHVLAVVVPRPNRRWRSVWPVVAMWLLAAAGPAVWYAVGTNVVGRFQQNKDSVGIAWIGHTYTLDANLVAETPAVFLTGLGIPKTPPSEALQEYFQLGSFVTVDGAMANAIRAALVFVAVVIVVGQVRWRRAGDGYGPSPLAPVRLLWAWAVTPVALLAMMSLPAGRTLSIYPHYMMFQPRFLAVCWPAFVLLAAAAIRNLPSWRPVPLRAACGGTVAAVMLAGGLTNQFGYRIPPHAAMLAVAMPYLTAGGPASFALAESRSDYTDLEPSYAAEVAFGVRPQFDLRYIQTWRRRTWPRSAIYPARLRDSAADWVSHLGRQSRLGTVDTVATFDRLGDTPYLTDEQMLRGLGRGWAKVREADFRLRTEWHPYLSFLYRARVWQRAGPEPRPVGRSAVGGR